MANIIQIKHGRDKPTKGILSAFELGFATALGKLFIADADQNVIDIKVGNSEGLILNGHHGATLPDDGVEGEVFFKYVT